MPRRHDPARCPIDPRQLRAHAAGRRRGKPGQVDAGRGDGQIRSGERPGDHTSMRQQRRASGRRRGRRRARGRRGRGRRRLAASGDGDGQHLGKNHHRSGNSPARPAAGYWERVPSHGARSFPRNAFPALYDPARPLPVVTGRAEPGAERRHGSVHEAPRDRGVSSDGPAHRSGAAASCRIQVPASWPADDPVAIGRRHVAITDRDEQHVTNQLQSAHNADSARLLPWSGT